MSKRSRLEDKFYLQYYQLVEFLNQYKINTAMAVFIIHMPNITILMDLITQLSSVNGFISRFTAIYFSQITNMLLQNSITIIHILESLGMFILTLPLTIVILLAINTVLTKTSLENERNIINIYRQSRALNFYRPFCRTFNEITFPIVTSLSIKLVQSDSISLPQAKTLGIIILIFNFINLFFYIYYDLEIYPQDSQYRRKDYKGALVDSCVVGIIIIIINMTSGLIPFIAITICFLGRLFLSFYLDILTLDFQLQRKFSLAIFFAISLCALVSKITGENGIMLCMAIIATGILSSFKNSAKSRYENKEKLRTFKQQINKQEQINFFENQSNSLDQLKQELWKGDKFIQVYRGLIRLSRCKASHRQQLIISILKSKCHQKQAILRGGSRVANPCDLFSYEQHIQQIVSIVVNVSQSMQDILNLMRSKAPKQRLFMEKVVKNIELIELGKKQLDEALKINNSEVKIILLLNVLCRGLQTDNQFMRKKIDQFREEILSQDQLKTRDKLFSINVALIVINVMEEIGKITRISKNMMGVLGFNSHHLINLPINGLMPYTIREIHDQVLITYINSFEASKTNRKSTIQSYAYNNNFHFQKVSVEYKFLMNNFDTLELSGVLEKIDTEQFLIFTNKLGDLQGWTQKAAQLLNLDDIAGAQCQKYSLLPLLPCLIKYKDEEFCCRTLLFKPSKIKNSKLSITPSMKSWDNPQQKQMEGFRKLLEEQQILDAYFADVEVYRISYLSGKFHNRVYEFKNLKRVDNMEKILQSLSKGPSKAKIPTVQSIKQNNIFNKSLQSMEESQHEFSMFKSESSLKNWADLNFHANFDGKNQINIDEIQYSKDIVSNVTFFSSRKLDNFEESAGYSQIQSIDKEAAFDFHQMPKIKRKSNILWVVLVGSAIILALIMYDQISLQIAEKQLQTNCDQIKKINRIEMILTKSIFNPNQTYIKEFAEGQLIISKTWLLSRQFPFTISDSQPQKSYNYFYILNVQIPSILDGLLSMASDMTENRYLFYRDQLFKNFYQLINLFLEIETEEKIIWEAQMQNLKLKTLIIVLIVSFSTIGFFVYFFTLKLGEDSKIKRVEGFFKFEKTDIDDLSKQVSFIEKFLKEKIVQWNIDGIRIATTENDEPVRRQQKLGTTNSDLTHGKSRINNGVLKSPVENQNTFLKFQLQQNIKRNNAYQQDQEHTQRRSPHGLAGIIISLGLQIIFLIAYGVLNSNKLQAFNQIFNKVNDVQKLFVLPNLEIAKLYITVPSSVLQHYKETMNQVMQNPSPYLHQVYSLLQEAPCSDCNFLPQILKTNYHSFFSYFQKQIEIRYRNNDTSNINQLIYATDLIGNSIYSAINILQLPIIALIILLYALSMIIFFITLFSSLRQIEDENLKLESFIKYFDNEIILKNKHLNAIFDQNI